MDFLLQALANPGEMSRSQWLLLSIMGFVLLGAAYLVWRLYKIILSSRKSTYVPNIGRKRLATARTGAPRPPTVEQADDAADQP